MSCIYIINYVGTGGKNFVKRVHMHCVMPAPSAQLCSSDHDVTSLVSMAPQRTGADSSRASSCIATPEPQTQWQCWQAVGYPDSICQLARRSPNEMLKRAYALCGQMTHFFAQLRLYLTFEALEPAWLTMQNQMRSATTLDQAGHPVNMHAVHACAGVSAWHNTSSGLAFALGAATLRHACS